MTETTPTLDNGKKKKISGIWLIAALLIVLIVTNFRPPVPTIHCTDELIQSKPEAIMLGTWWCSYCYKARKYFEENNIRYCEYDIEHSEQGGKLYGKFGDYGIPVIFINDDVYYGYNKEALDTALNK